MRHPDLAAVLLALAALAANATTTQAGDPRLGEVPREEIPEACKWDVDAVFPDEAAWQAEHDAVREALPALARYEADPAGSPQRLLEVLRLRDDLQRRINRLRIYATCRRDVALDCPDASARSGRTAALVRDFDDAASFIGAAVKTLDADQRATLLAAEPGLRPWTNWFERMARQAEPALAPEVEKLLDQADAARGSGGDIWQSLVFTEIPFGEVVDDQGDTIAASAGQTWRALASQDRGYRERAWRARQEAYGAFRTTLATLVSDHLRGTVFQARARGHESALAYCMSRHELPPAVYENLIGAVRSNLAPLQRWLEIRKRVLGYQDLHPWDANVSLFPAVDRMFTWNEAVALTKHAVTPLGRRYGDVVTRALDGRWIDAYPHPGKSGGGYSSGAHPGVHPFVKMNFTGTAQEVSTLVHETGHMVHATMVSESQPPVDADYMPFMAEIASTTAEVLFHDRMASEAGTPLERAYYLEQHLNNLALMLYTTTLGAEFEKRLYDLVEAGEPVTAGEMDDLWLELNRDYFGPAIAVDQLEAHGWAGFLHWHLDYYMFSYATSFAAAEQFAARITAEGRPAVDDFIAFLEAGRSAPPLQILQASGVDMSGPEPIEAAARQMDDMLDEMERLLDEMDGA